MEEMSIYDICKLSQDIQDASNGAVVAGELQRVIRALYHHGIGSDAAMKHPAVICMIDKLSSLAGIQWDYLKEVSAAFTYCNGVLKE